MSNAQRCIKPRANAERIDAIREADKECFTCPLLRCIHEIKNKHITHTELNSRCNRAQFLKKHGLAPQLFVTPDIQNEHGVSNGSADDARFVVHLQLR